MLTQSTGLCDSGVKPYTAAHMWKVAVQPVLLYACQSVLNKKNQQYVFSNVYLARIKYYDNNKDVLFSLNEQFQ